MSRVTQLAVGLEKVRRKQGFVASWGGVEREMKVAGPAEGRGFVWMGPEKL